MNTSHPRLARHRTWIWVALAMTAAAALGTFGWIGWRVWPRNFPLPRLTGLLQPSFGNGRIEVRVPDRTLVGLLNVYDDELYAFLMFDYLRSRSAVQGFDILLDHQPEHGRPQYRILAVCTADVLACVPHLALLEHDHLAGPPAWGFLPDRTIETMRQQTALFVEAYSAPVAARFETMSAAQRVRYVRRFLRFKSAMDRRVRLGSSGLQPLSREEAGELAADIIDVADFYHLPLDLFLGIGAMENNYISVPGDLEHRVWKRHAQKGDIVIRRERHRVLVSDFSLGRWQITRQTLRFAHSLYLKDKRDYSTLPERLRPSRQLDLDQVSSAVLTTYAGLLLRYLLDYFHGDVAKAVGAYNGGVRNPNEEYEAGVRHVAEYARRILGRAAAMKNAAVTAVHDGSG